LEISDFLNRGWIDELQKKLMNLLTEAAEISVTLDVTSGIVQGAPHHVIIELRAHELGQQLSREIQQRHLRTMITQ
jgi:hypothetical protein